MITFGGETTVFRGGGERVSKVTSGGKKKKVESGSHTIREILSVTLRRGEKGASLIGKMPG